MKVSIGSDHAGFNYKELIREYLETKEIEVFDEGTYSINPVDYPDYASKVAYKVVDKAVDFGIVICGTGLGVSIAANKVNGIRAAVVSTAFTAESAKNHNHANVIAFGSRVNSIEEVKEYLDIYMNTKESEEKRHINRVNKIHKLEG
ncbi:MAG: ribose 5-phosphate isomerase B [Tenericutes bacterium]|nr:ribose 5-phosphate isomerase B [Mycoplasmatota bacterium]